MNVKLINENNSFIIAVSKLHGLLFSNTFFVFGLLCCRYICDIYLNMLDFNEAYASSERYLLIKLPHADLHIYNRRQILLFYMKWFNCG